MRGDDSDAFVAISASLRAQRLVWRSSKSEGGSNPLSPRTRKDGLLRCSRNDGGANPSQNALPRLRRIFLQETLQILLHRIRQRDRVTHVVDRAVEAEAHHARELGLAVRF